MFKVYPDIEERKLQLEVQKNALERNKLDFERYKLYFDERKVYIDASRESARSFDNTMVTLSAGALALSITFVEKLAPHPTSLLLLFGAWASFIVALIASLSSHLFAQSAIRNEIVLLDQEQIKGSPEDDKTTEKKTSDSAAVTSTPQQTSTPNGSINWPRRITFIINILAITFFILGVILLTFFSLENVPVANLNDLSNGGK
jgi:hypothetical protein